MPEKTVTTPSSVVGLKLPDGVEASQQDDVAVVSVSDFLESVGGQVLTANDDVMRSCLTQMNEQCPSTLALAVHLLTTENEELRSAVKHSIISGINDFYRSYRKTIDTETLAHHSEAFRFEVVSGVPCCLAMEVDMWWVLVSMSTLPVIPNGLSNPVRTHEAFKSLHQMVTQWNMLPTQLFSNGWYWRGLLAQSLVLHLTEEEPDELNIPDTEFIHWAGTHEDIAKVMLLASVYRTTNLRFLESVIENGGVASPLYDGKL